MGFPVQSMLTALRSFRGLAHRCELVGEHRSVRWYDDSKGTNVGATMAAIQGFGHNLVLIAGGIGKGADFSPLRDIVRDRVVDTILFGQDADNIESAVSGVTAIHRARDLGEAVTQAAGYAKAGQIVLFSPACSSFDMFENYEQRGVAFKRLVMRLEQHR